MKIVLHMGLSKTGTTSLQQSLHGIADSLPDRGVLYPKFHDRQISQHLLLGLCGGAARLHPWFINMLGGVDAVISAARQAWETTLDDIGRLRPELLILSSEYLSHHADTAAKARLARILAEISDDIVPVIYVRHPVDHYRSRLQQNLKTLGRPFPPTDRNLRQAILDIEAAFGRRPELVAFDRKTLIGGDVIPDFASRFLGPWLRPEDLPPIATNVGLSAEALVLMARLRHEAGGTPAAARRISGLVRRLTALDAEDPPAQSMTLLPEVADYALRTANGHRWLVETGQLVIPGLDISRIDGAEVPEWLRTAAPETLILHDPARLDRLRKALKKSGALGFLNSPQPKPSEKPKPRIRDLLLRFLRRKLASIQDRNTGAAPTRHSTDPRLSQGDRNEDHSTDGNLGAGPRNRA